MIADPDARLPSSFRDPAGFVFPARRHVLPPSQPVLRGNLCHPDGLGALRPSRRGRPPHPSRDRRVGLAPAPEAGAVIRPAQLKFVSYPFEWSFSQLKAAALATLHVQRRALDHGLSLKDASARNIQLHEGRPRLIDTLSFERYEPGFPWVGYRQFCQHFLAPLAVMAYTDVRLGALLQSHLDGVPLDLASRAAPLALAPPPGLLMHLHVHSRAQARAATSTRKRADLAGRMSRRRLDALLESLESAVRRIAWNPADTPWAGYGDQTSYTSSALADKKRLVAEHLAMVSPESVWDIGGNTATSAGSPRRATSPGLDRQRSGERSI